MARPEKELRLTLLFTLAALLLMARLPVRGAEPVTLSVRTGEVLDLSISLGSDDRQDLTLQAPGEGAGLARGRRDRLSAGRFGRYEGPCDSSSSQITSNQRRVILIAVKARDEGLDFEECLKQGLYSHPQLRVLLGNYSRFELGYDEAFGRGGDA